MADESDIIFLTELRAAIDGKDTKFLDVRAPVHVRAAMRYDSKGRSEAGLARFSSDAISMLAPLTAPDHAFRPVGALRAIASLLDGSAGFYKSTRPSALAKTPTRASGGGGGGGRKKGGKRRKRRRGKQPQAQAPPRVLETGLYASQREGSGVDMASAHLVRNANLFGSLQGFVNTARLLEAKEPPPAPAAVSALVDIAYGVRKVLEPPTGAIVSKAVHTGASTCVKSAPLDDLSLAAPGLASRVGAVLAEFAGTREGAREAAKLRRVLVSRLAASPRLADAVRCAKLLAEILKKITADGPADEAKAMRAWFADARPVEGLLGGDLANSETLLRALKPVFIGMARAEILNSDLLNRLWRAWQGRHESVAKVVLTVIGELTGHLPPEARVQLQQNMCRLAPDGNLVRHYSSALCQMMRTFGERALAAAPAGDATRYGAQSLWSIASSDRDGVPALARAAAVDALAALIRTEAAARLRPGCIEAALRIILQPDVTGPAATAMARLACRVLDACAPAPASTDAAGAWAVRRGDRKRSDSASRASTIEQLDTRVNLLRALLGGLPGIGGDSGPSVDASTLNPATAMARLDVICYILRHSTLQLTTPGAVALWQCAAARGADPGFATRIYALFSDAMPVASSSSPAVSALSPEAMRDLLQGPMCATPTPEAFPPRAFTAWRKAFIAVNRKLKRLVNVKSASKYQVSSQPTALIGVKVLWAIALRARDPSTYKHAIKLLIGIHSQLAPAQAQRAAEVRRKFLENSFKSLAGPNARRAMLVLRGSLYASVRGLWVDQKDFSSVGDDIKIIIAEDAKSSKNGKVTSRTIRMSSGATISDMRLAVARALEHPASCTNMVLAPRRAGDAPIPIISIECVDRHPIARLAVSARGVQGGWKPIRLRCTRMNKPTAPPAQSWAAAIGDKAFTLFKLLSVESPRGRKNEEKIGPIDPLAEVRSAWKTLCNIPPSQALIDQFRAMTNTPDKAPQLSTLLPPNQPLQLLYVLRTINMLLEKPEFETDFCRSRRVNFYSAFVSCLGLDHLLGELFRMFPERSSEEQPGRGDPWLLAKKSICAAEMLRVLCHDVKGSILACERVGAPQLRLMRALLDCICLVLRLSNMPLPRSASNARSRNRDLAQVDMAVPLAVRLLVANLRPKSGGQDAKGQQDPAQDSKFRLGLSEVARGVLECPRRATRKVLAKALQDLMASSPTTRTHLEGEMLALIGSAADHGDKSQDFFGVLEGQLGAVGGAEGASSAGAEQRAKVMLALVQIVQSHPVVEITETDADYALRGVLRLTTLLLSGENADRFRRLAAPLVSEIFNGYLFPGDPPDEAEVSAGPPLPKCKSPQSRKDALAVLGALCRGDADNTSALLRLMRDAYARGSPGGSPGGSEWAVDPASLTRHARGVGLRNLGCTCYMNAFFQQLHAIPGLTDDILSVRGKGDSPVPAEAALRQVQTLLLHLQRSDARWYDPTPQIAVLLGKLGVDERTQMDAGEFALRLFDWLDEELKHTSNPDVLGAYFDGELSEQLTQVRDPARSRGRTQPFRFLKLSVRGKARLRESLGLFTQAEVLPGVRWEGDDHGVSTRKQTLVARAPRLLMLHLNRLDYDVATNRRVKLNSELAFPQRLDLKPFLTQRAAADGEPGAKPEGEPDESSDDDDDAPSRGAAAAHDASAEKDAEKDAPRRWYHLVGVVCHQGSAHRGHYYVFAKKRPRSSGSQAVWTELNDINVRDFSEGKLEAETFGGSESIHIEGAAEKITLEKDRSAYMLLYERERPTGASTQTDEKAEIQNSPTVAPHLLPELRRIARANYSLSWDRFTLDAQHLVFASEFLWAQLLADEARDSQDEKAASDDGKGAVEPPFPRDASARARAQATPRGRLALAASSYVLCAAGRSKEWCAGKVQAAQGPGPWLKKLVDLVRRSPTAAALILQSIASAASLRRLFVDCPCAVLRSGAADLAAACLRQVASRETDPQLPPYDTQNGDKKRQSGSGRQAGPSSPPNGKRDRERGSINAKQSDGGGGSAAAPLTPPPRVVRSGVFTRAAVNSVKGISPKSPISVLRGIGTATSRLYKDVGVSTIEELAMMSEGRRASLELPDQTVSDHVRKAFKAIDVLNQVDVEQKKQKHAQVQRATPADEKKTPPMNKKGKTPADSGGADAKCRFFGLCETSIAPVFIASVVSALRGPQGDVKDGARRPQGGEELATSLAALCGDPAAGGLRRLFIESDAIPALVRGVVRSGVGDQGATARIRLLNALASDQKACKTVEAGEAGPSDRPLSSAKTSPFLDTLLSIPGDPGANGAGLKHPAAALVARLCEDDAKFSSLVINWIAERVDSQDWDGFAFALCVLHAVLSVQDALVTERATLALGALLPVFKANKQAWRATILCVSRLMGAADANLIFRETLRTRAAKVEWVAGWVSANSRAPSARKTTGVVLHKKDMADKRDPNAPALASKHIARAKKFRAWLSREA